MNSNFLYARHLRKPFIVFLFLTENHTRKLDGFHLIAKVLFVRFTGFGHKCLPSL